MAENTDAMRDDKSRNGLNSDSFDRGERLTGKRGGYPHAGIELLLPHFKLIRRGKTDCPKCEHKIEVMEK